MPYTKIKHSKGTTTLTRVEDRSSTDSVEQTLTSHDPPRPEFVTALQALTAWVVRICELPINYADGMTITGVSLTLGEYGGCVVTALKKVDGANAPVVINTPHVPETPTSENGPALVSSTIQLLSALEDEADKFWRGERAQLDAFEGEGAPESEGERLEGLSDDDFEQRCADHLAQGENDADVSGRTTEHTERVLDAIDRTLAGVGRATISVNGGPEVDLDDTEAAMNAMRPMFDELASRRAAKSEVPS